jgi:hypothetical protein
MDVAHAIVALCSRWRRAAASSSPGTGRNCRPFAGGAAHGTGGDGRLRLPVRAERLGQGDVVPARRCCWRITAPTARSSSSAARQAIARLTAVSPDPRLNSSGRCPPSARRTGPTPALDTGGSALPIHPGPPPASSTQKGAAASPTASRRTPSPLLRLLYGRLARPRARSGDRRCATPSDGSTMMGRSGRGRWGVTPHRAQQRWSSVGCRRSFAIRVDPAYPGRRRHGERFQGQGGT